MKFLYPVFCVLLLLSAYFYIENEAVIPIRFPREWGHKGYIEYRPGTEGTRLILTSVHGGCLIPKDLPIRQNGCYDFKTGKCSWNHDCQPKSAEHCFVITQDDSCTVELATSIWREWEHITGERPHLIISHLDRGVFDGNRDLGDAAQGHPDTEAAWRDLHRFINKAKQAIQGIGLLIDVHGQAHREEWVELGYGIKADFYNSDVLKPEVQNYIQNAIRLSNHSKDDVIRGDYSLGKYLQSYGHSAIPSPNNPNTQGGNYFSGGDLGYITWTHGSWESGRFDSILVENPIHLRTPMAIVDYAKHFAQAAYSFTTENYGHDFI